MKTMQTCVHYFPYVSHIDIRRHFTVIFNVKYNSRYSICFPRIHNVQQSLCLMVALQGAFQPSNMRLFYMTSCSRLFKHWSIMMMSAHNTATQTQKWLHEEQDEVRRSPHLTQLNLRTCWADIQLLDTGGWWSRRYTDTYSSSLSFLCKCHLVWKCATRPNRPFWGSLKE